jgi:hypothetical protein
MGPDRHIEVEIVGKLGLQDLRFFLGVWCTPMLGKNS